MAEQTTTMPSSQNSSSIGQPDGLIAPLEIIKIVVLTAVIALAIPAFFGSFWLRAFTSSAIFSLAAAGIALLYGRLGLVSLAQVALVGVGAWSTMRIFHATGWPFEIVLLLGGISTAFISLIISLPALRVRGLYLALVTLMTAGGFQVIVNATGFPDGGTGFLGRVESGNRIAMSRPWLAQTDPAFFRYVVVVVALGFLLIELNRRARPGRAWAMIRKSEASALSAGVNVVYYKTWAFMLAGFLSGIAGGLMAGSVGQLGAGNFPANDSILLFALTIVGGTYHWLGAILSGLLYRAVPSLLNSWGVDGDLSLIFFGAALLHALITAPTGVAGQLIGLGQSIMSRFSRGGQKQTSKANNAGSES